MFKLFNIYILLTNLKNLSNINDILEKINIFLFNRRRTINEK